MLLQFAIIFILISISRSCMIGSIPNVPQSVIKDADNSLMLVEKNLIAYDQKIYSPLQLYWSLKDAIEKLDKVKEYINTKSLVVGKSNQVVGIGNYIIGNYNRIKGVNNWIISRNHFFGKQSQTLIFKHWKIELSNLIKVIIQPSEIIKKLGDIQMLKFQRWVQKLQKKGNKNEDILVQFQPLIANICKIFGKDSVSNFQRELGLKFQKYGEKFANGLQYN